MSEISTLVSGLETRVATVLGSTYSELGFAIDVEKNPFKGSAKRYGVVAGDIAEVEDGGVLGSYTVTQNFTIKVTDKYATSPAGDNSQRDTVIGLNEKCLLIYKDIVNNKAGSPSLVITVLPGMSTVSTFYDDDYVCESTMEVQLLYRKQL